MIYNKHVKFIGETFAYLKKSFWLLAAIVAVPSVAACFLSTPYWEVSFVAAIDDPLMRVSETFAVIFGDSWQYLWPVIVVSALQIFASAFAMSAVDRHFRTGRLSLRSPWRLVNNSVFPMFLGVLIMCVVSVVLRFVLFGLVTLVQAIAGASGMNAGATLTVISAIAVGLFVVHVLAITPMLYLTPIMFIYGYKFRDAAGMSFKLISGKKVFVGLLLPLLLCAGLQLLVGFIGVHRSIAIVCNFVIFLVTNVYVIAYVAVTFYNISDLERRDVKPYAAFVLPKPAPAAPAAEKTDGAAAEVKDDKKPTEKKPKKQAQPKRAAQDPAKNNADGKPSDKKPRNGRADSRRADSRRAEQSKADSRKAEQRKADTSKPAPSKAKAPAAVQPKKRKSAAVKDLGAVETDGEGGGDGV